MAVSSVALRETRAGLVKKSQGLVDRAATENREMSAEEVQQFEAYMADVDDLKKRIDRIEKLENIASELEDPAERSGRNIGQMHGVRGHDGASALARGDFRHWLRTGEVRGDFRNEQARGLRVPRHHHGDRRQGRLSHRTGDDLLRYRQGRRGPGLHASAGDHHAGDRRKEAGHPKALARMADADWTTEVAAVTEDTTGAYGRRDLEPYLLTKLAKVSMRTLNLAADSETEVTDELAYKFGVTEEKAYLTGNGSNKPLGVFTADANGISTARDVTAAGTATLTGDDFIDAKYSVKPGYLADPKAGWIMHRLVAKAVRKLKASGTGEYIWQPGLQKGQPDALLDMPIYMSEYAPSTIATGQYVATVGNYKYYRIAEVKATFLQRLVEHYADTNEVGFIGRRWIDGDPVLEEAFARLKMA